MSTTEVAERHEVVEDAPIEQIITEEFIERFEKQAALYQERYLPLCLKLTNGSDWINHGSEKEPKFSLQCSGAEKLCNPLGIVWDRPAVVKHKLQDEKGAFYEYEIEGIVQCRVLKRYGWFTGNCSSRDRFFNARGSFDEGDIRKAAFSNFLVNAVTRLAGIRNPSPEMLQKAGLDPSRVGKIDYSGNRSEEAGGHTISEAQAKRLYAILKEKNIPEGKAKAYLAHRGYQSSKDIQRKDYNSICEWAQAGGPQWQEKSATNEQKASSPEPLPNNKRAEEIYQLATKHKLTNDQMAAFIASRCSQVKGTADLDKVTDLQLGMIAKQVENGTALKWCQQHAPAGNGNGTLTNEQQAVLLAAATEQKISEADLNAYLINHYNEDMNHFPARLLEEALAAVQSGKVASWCLEVVNEPGANG